MNVPSIGDSITKGTIVKWCIPPGSSVKEGGVLGLKTITQFTGGGWGGGGEGETQQSIRDYSHGYGYDGGGS